MVWPRWETFLFLMFRMMLLPQVNAETDTLTQSQQLSLNQTLVSAGKIFKLGFFSLGNSSRLYLGLWFKNIPSQRILWVANREDPLPASDSAVILKIATDGNLKIVNGNLNTIWSTSASLQSNNTIVVLTDKWEFILKDSVSGISLWDSFKYPCDTLLSGMNIGYSTRTGEKFVLSSWQAEDDPSPGKFATGLSVEMPPQGFTWTNYSRPYWRGGPWDGGDFIGIPDDDKGFASGIDVISNKQQESAFLSFNNFYDSDLVIMVLKPSGLLQMMVWVEELNAWKGSWVAPENPCDVYRTCGPNGVCDKNKSPVCDCLRGFALKPTKEWNRGNWTDGCVRQTKLLCEISTSGIAPKALKNDTFLQLTEMKLPDHYTYLRDQYSVQNCKEWCLNNCSCVAYAYPDTINCMVWTSELMDVQQFPSDGMDLFLRLPYSELDKRKKKLVIGFTTVSSILILGIFGCIFCRWKANQRGYRKNRIKDLILADKGQSSREMSTDNLWEGQALPNDSSELPLLDFAKLATATDNFSEINKIGAGGFGPVYKVIPIYGQLIAVKRLSSYSGQGIEEFKNEVLLISKLQHRNLVRILAYCVHGKEKLRVYEYMAKRSLDTLLFDPKQSHQLPWPKRFDMIHGIARGLLYLHRDSCLLLIHRDLKASNVLLDDDMTPKISDFGLARTFQVTHELNTQRIAGTFGYMSPEYAMGGVFSEKSDVYSFGVLLLEIVSGRRNRGIYDHERHLNLLSYAWQLWTESKGLDLMDKSISDSRSSTTVLRCIHIGLLCVQDHAADRPLMSSVVLMLSSEMDLPQPKQPTFIFQRRLNSSTQSQISKVPSVNDITVSVAEGR
ncbi:G-type lectin S-receptor-like serine/threonine-protein kinase At1g61370 isoform X2 [Lycium ferocissimum]|uniref:G-type lectin S-receptor-like serine/threonine-protein kinase At1g61370 isoform X2 n=1 Tax=Lycium ferocissimum TaxID=112874 RepID=UPI00281531D7|nr:G-type lectin S-receptor-like serine/threonine-protein kinase At1g61370 isoform X2 [Lycium ferocissimum]